MSPPTRTSDTDVPAKQPTSSDPLASAKALGIAELLQIILQEVPVEHLTALRRVARIWNDIVSELNHIDPVSIGHGDEDCTCLGADACKHMPHYASNIAIRGNPVFKYIHIYRGAAKEQDGGETTSNTLRHYRGLQLKSWSDTSELDTNAHHFLTDPPITMVTVGDSRFGASLRVPMGIRVGDLRDALAKLVNTNSGYAKPSPARPIAWYACTSDIVRRTNDTSNGEGDCDNGDDLAVGMLTLSVAT